MKKRYTSFVTSFLKKNNAPRELVDTWLSSRVQEEWRKLYITTAPKKRCTSYILYCLDKRRHVTSLHPKKSPSQITSMLASQWRQHKQADDDVYRYYRSMDTKQVFCTKMTSKMRLKYPGMDDEEIAVLVEKMFIMSHHSGANR